MAEGIYTVPGVEITDHIEDVIMTDEPRLIENLLMDGVPHMQTVGTAITLANVKAFATETARETLDYYAAIAQPVTVKWLTRYATGYIRAVPQWTQNGHRYYSANIQIVVTAAGNQ
jgi:hypothetical protein